MMGAEAVTVRTIARHDLKAVVTIHMAAFPGFLMSLLGPGFLRRYYETVLDYEGRIFVGVFAADGQLLGFVAGFENPAEFYRLFARRKVKIIAGALWHVAVRPSIWRRVIGSVSQVHARGQAAHSDLVTAELASLAVDPRCPRRGHGRMLVRCFLENARQRSIDVVSLTTDSRDNVAVNAFYNNLGFSRNGTCSRGGGRVMNSYLYEMAGDVPSDRTSRSDKTNSGKEIR